MARAQPASRLIARHVMARPVEEMPMAGETPRADFSRDVRIRAANGLTLRATDRGEGEVFDRFYASLDHRRCKQCGTVCAMPTPAASAAGD